MNAIDLFAGPGGWSLACQELGINETGVEFDHAACETRRAAGLNTLETDVRHHGPFLRPISGAGQSIGFWWRNDHHGLIASPPCPTFSTAGKGSGRREFDKIYIAIKSMAAGQEVDYNDFNDERTALVLEPLRWVLEAHRSGAPYQWLAFEQVPTVLPVWEAMAEAFRALGYSVATGILNAEQYGVPQTRRRAILIANLEHEVSLPTPTHSKYYNRTPEKLDEGVQKWVSMAEALGRGMTHRPSMTATGGGTGRGGAEPFDNGARKSMRRGIEAGRWVTTNYLRPNGTVRNEDEPAPTTTGSKDFGERRWLASPSGVTGPVHRPIEEPAATVTGKGNYYAYPEGYKDQSVRVSVEEAAILQTFPADYPWQGTKSKQFQQVGNAIPPRLAAVVLKAATGIEVGTSESEAA